MPDKVVIRGPYASVMQRGEGRNRTFYIINMVTSAHSQEYYSRQTACDKCRQLNRHYHGERHDC